MYAYSVLLNVHKYNYGCIYMNVWFSQEKNTLGRETKADIKKMISNWKQLEKTTQDRVRWRVLVGDLCSSTRDNKHK